MQQYSGGKWFLIKNKQTEKKNKTDEGLHRAVKYAVFSSISLFNESAHIKQQQHSNEQDIGVRVCIYVDICTNVFCCKRTHLSTARISIRGKEDAIYIYMHYS